MPLQPSSSTFHARLSQRQDCALLQEIWEHFPEHIFLIRLESPQRFVVEAVNPAQQAMQRARRQHAPLALLILDIDGFKANNDTRGHLAGDAILREVAETLSEALRESDLLGRFGGDKFVVVLPDTRAEDAERLRAAVAQRCGCTLGLGIADFTPHDDFASLVERADRALLRAKRARGVSR